MKTVHNKNYMSIAVSVLISKFTARFNFSCNLTGNRPQSATFHTANS